MVTVVLWHPMHLFRRTVNFPPYSLYCFYTVAHPRPNSYFSIRASETAARSFFRSWRYYCLMKLSSWFVIFLLRLSSLSPSALYRYALWNGLRMYPECSLNILTLIEIARIYCSKAIYNQEQKVLCLRLLVINLLLLLRKNEMILSGLICSIICFN